MSEGAWFGGGLSVEQGAWFRRCGGRGGVWGGGGVGGGGGLRGCGAGGGGLGSEGLGGAVRSLLFLDTLVLVSP